MDMCEKARIQILCKFQDPQHRLRLLSSPLIGHDLRVKAMRSSPIGQYVRPPPVDKKSLFMCVIVVQVRGEVNIAAPYDKMPVFQKGGTIIPRRERVRRYFTFLT